MESVNVASVIAMLHQRIKLWAPNYIDTTEFNRIREAVNEALDANSERNKELDALRAALTEKDREIERLKASVQNLKGAMMADDDRLTAAGNRVGLYFGCDTPDAMADEVESLRSQLSASQAREREAVERAEKAEAQRRHDDDADTACRNLLCEERDIAESALAAARKALEDAQTLIESGSPQMALMVILAALNGDSHANRG